MIEDRTWGSVLFNVVNHAFLVVMGVVWLYPMARVIALSLSDPTMILLGEVDWYPRKPTLKGIPTSSATACCGGPMPTPCCMPASARS